MKIVQKLILIAVFTLILAACGPQSPVVNTEYVLTTAMRDGKFVYLGVDGDINGVVNPALHARPGERITVMLVNSGEGTHDIDFTDIHVRSDKITKKGETTSITFVVPDDNVTIEYHDTTHEKLGMQGLLIVGELAGLTSDQSKPPGLYDNELAFAAFQKGGCGACHTIPGVPGAVGTIGPDLSEIGTLANARIESGEYAGSAKTADEYLLESIQSPDAFVSPACPSGPCIQGIMPASLAQALSDTELEAVVRYLAALPDGAVAVAETVDESRLSLSAVQAVMAHCAKAQPARHLPPM